MTASKALRVLALLTLIGSFSSLGLAAQETGVSLTVDLMEFEDSGVSGSALLVETTDGGTHVSMNLQGEGVEGNHPTHIHSGTCSNFEPDPLYPLETVNLSPISQEGISESDIPGVSLASLRDGEFVIVVHRSPELLTEYLICGEIMSAVVGQAPKVTPAEGSAVAHHMPVSGSGDRLASAVSSPMALAAVTLAVLATGSAIVVRASDRTGRSG